ncbi:hypothetical protein E2P71_07890 [Candidatus Bathyarchaeota archaeon]|jgi:hypothetical protein|nr:hypothetical protein E2P71_07890 [Candidatus Bathyarchaeota archaeon]
MKSYIKLYGPPLEVAIKVLRKIAVDFPEVCVMDPGIEAALSAPKVSGGGSQNSISMVMDFFGGPEEISEERCGTILSKSRESVGKYDFYYEWFKKPSISQIEDLIEKIDEGLAPTGVRYTITTK